MSADLLANLGGVGVLALAVLYELRAWRLSSERRAEAELVAAAAREAGDRQDRLALLNALIGIHSRLATLGAASMPPPLGDDAPAGQVPRRRPGGARPGTSGGSMGDGG